MQKQQTPTSLVRQESAVNKQNKAKTLVVLNTIIICIQTVLLYSS